VTFDYDSANYNEPVIPDLNWQIANNWVPTEYTASEPNSSGWLNRDFVITVEDGYKVSLTNTADGTWEDALTYSAETAEGSVTFYLKKIADGTISLAKTVSYRIDKMVPAGKVEFVERSAWEEFVNAITFGLLYKDEVTVKVTANDDRSGIAKIEYASADTAMTLDEVKAIAGWTEYNGSFVVTLEDARKFVYFIRITDHAGNVTYRSTDGAEYDTSAPVIEGVENGKTYYTTQKVTVTDKHLDAVTFNGNPAAEVITLDGNREATYTIVATDKLGNTATVTVTMKPIKELAKATENLGSDNVTPDDAPALKELVDKLDELLADPDTSDDGERETLEQHKVIAESLLQIIEDALEGINKVEEMIESLPDNIKKKDEAAVKAADEAYNALSDYEKSLVSESAKKALADAKAALTELNRPDGPGSPATGSDSNHWLWMALLIVSGAGILGITLCGRKREVATKR